MTRPERHPRPVVVERATFGPFQYVRTDDGREYLKGQLPTGGFHQRRPGCALTVARLRALVATIDAAPNLATLATLERMIVAQYVGDVAARELVEWITQRTRAFGAPAPPDLPPAA